MSKMQRTKGARGERELAHKFEAIDPDARRGGGQSRSGADMPDVVCPAYPWLWIESKIGKHPPYRRAYLQAEAACGAQQTPVVCVRHDGDTQWYATVSLDLLLLLLAGLDGVDVDDTGSGRIAAALVKDAVARHSYNKEGGDE